MSRGNCEADDEIAGACDFVLEGKGEGETNEDREKEQGEGEKEEGKETGRDMRPSKAVRDSEGGG